MSLQITTQPTTEPVTVDEVRKILRLATFDDNDIIAAKISAARDYCESVSGWSLAGKSYRLTADRFPFANGPIELLRPPLVSVDSIQYLDDDYQWQTWDASEYWVADSNRPALIVPKKGKTYPDPVEAPGSVRIDFTVGVCMEFQPLFEAIRQLAVHMYEHPEVFVAEDIKEMPLAISSLLRVKKPYYRF